MARNPSHLGSNRKPSAVGSASVSLASMGSIGGASGNAAAPLASARVSDCRFSVAICGFVELVERGRPDWLASACQQRVRCDVLIISGHFNGRTDFFSDRPDKREYLPVDEMERVSCSDSCSGLFAQVKEVYLFGCNTLN